MAVNEKVHAYKRVFSGEFGTPVLVDLCKFCHLMENSYSGNKDEAIFKEGRRSVVLMIIQQMGMSVEDVLKMSNVNIEDEEL